jgi:hypothetical protein
MGRNFPHHFGRGSTRVGIRKIMERAKNATISPALNWMLLHIFHSPLGLQMERDNL